MSSMFGGPAREAIDAFAKLPSVRVYGTRRGSRGRCHAASVAFAMWLRVTGVDNRIVRFLGPRPGLRRHLADVELEAVDEIPQHAVLVEETAVVDFTWRMWNSAHAHPRISTLEEYAVDFARLDETVCGICGAYELFNGSRPDCRHLTPEEERRVVDRLRVVSDADVGIVARRLIAEAEDARDEPIERISDPARVARAFGFAVTEPGNPDAQLSAGAKMTMMCQDPRLLGYGEDDGRVDHR